MLIDCLQLFHVNLTRDEVALLHAQLFMEQHGLNPFFVLVLLCVVLFFCEQYTVENVDDVAFSVFVVIIGKTATILYTIHKLYQKIIKWYVEDTNNDARSLCKCYKYLIYYYDENLWFIYKWLPQYYSILNFINKYQEISTLIWLLIVVLFIIIFQTSLLPFAPSLSHLNFQKKTFFTTKKNIFFGH